MPNINDIFLYFNVAMIGIIVLIALVGFMRGTRKSIFYLIPTVVIFGGGWLLMGVATNFIMDFDLSSYNLVLNGVAIPSVKEGILLFLTDSVPEAVALMNQDTLAREMVLGITNMVIKILYLIVLVVLAFTVFKVLTDILWMIFKPKKKKNGKKRKKTMGSRFGGLGIGAAKGLFYVLLITFPLAGIASIFGSLASVTKDPSEDMRYELVFVQNQVSLVETNTATQSSSELDFLFDFFDMYKNSVPSKVFGTVKVDTFIFDGIFSFKVNNTSIQLRKELETVAKALNRSELLKESNFDINKLLEEDPETLKLIIDDLSKLNLVKVAIPMAIEAVLYLEDGQGNPVVSLPEGIEIDITDIKKTNFAGDVKKLGYAFVDITTLLPSDDNAEINYLGFDPVTVKSIMANIGSTEIVSTFAPIAISYLVSMDAVTESLDTLGLTVEDLKLDEIEDWGAEFAQFGVIYEKVYDLQIKSFDTNETFEFVTAEKVQALSEAIFDSVLIANATPVLVETLVQGFVEEDYRKDLVFDHSIWDADEFAALVNAGVTIMKSGIVGAEDMQATFAALTDQSIDDLALYLSSSKFVTRNLNVIIQSVGISDLVGQGVELVTLTAEEWSETELRSLFHAAKIIFVEGQENLIKLSDEKILALSTHLSKSKFITRNIEAIIDVALGSVDLGVNVKIGTFAHWNDPAKAQNEFFYLMKSARIITDKGSDTDSLLSLTDEELDVFLNSHLISETLVNVLIEFSKEGNSLELLVGVDDPDVAWYDTDFVATTFTWDGLKMVITPVEGATKYNIYKDGEKIGATRLPFFTVTEFDPEATYEVEAFTEGELRKMFLAVGSITGSINSDEGFSTEMITSLTDEEIDNIMISDILVRSMIDFLEKESQKVDSFIAIPEGDLTSTEPETKLNAWKDRIEGEKIVHGELSRAFRAIRILLDGVSLDDFAVEDFIGIDDADITELLKSFVISESIIVQIEKLADDEESLFNIPEGVGLGKDDSRDAWLNTYEYDENYNLVLVSEGEISHLLRAFRVINPEGELENIDVANILIEENREIVLQSLIVEETLIHKIREVGDGQADISIPTKYKVGDTSVWKKSAEGEGELRRILNSLSYIMGENDSINDIKFDLSAVIADQDEILKSEIIIETIVVKISEQEEIHIPESTYFGLNDPDDRTQWMNEYELDENNNYVYDENGKVVVLRHGEISRLLNAADLILEEDPDTGERSFEGFSFDINVAFDEEKQDVLLRSWVISETIVMKIFEEAEKENSDIAIPAKGYVNPKTEEDLNTNNRDKWFNQYDAAGNKIHEGEIAHLLGSVEILIGEEGSFEDFELDMNVIFDDDNQKIILRSTVISESIVYRVYKESLNEDSMLQLPSTLYVEDYNDPRDINRSKWFNAYDHEGNILTQGELAFMLNAVEVLIGPDGDFDNLDFKLNTVFDDDNQKVVLRSSVISESIVHKIYEESENEDSMIRIPNQGYVNPIESEDRSKWFNTYDEDGNVKTYGEISFLLEAAEILVGEDGDFENLDFKLSVLFDAHNQEIVLRSTVISESIVHRIYEENDNEDSMVHVPSERYVEALNDPRDINREKWYNQYDDNGILLHQGELAHLLNAVHVLVGPDGDFENLDFKLSTIFDDDNQKIVLRSTVISESIVHRVYEEAENEDSMLRIPNKGYVETLNDENRDKWFNTYDDAGNILTYGELSFMLEAVEILVGPEGDFENLDFKLNVVFDETNQFIVLRSTVISESIVNRVYEESANNDSMLHVPSERYVERLEDPRDINREKWFNQYKANGDLLQQGEIAHLLNAVHVLVGPDGDFENLDFKLSTVFDDDNQKIVLRSTVISESIVHRVYEESENEDSMLRIPSKGYVEELSDENRDKWFNTYDDDGNILSFGEISFMLEATQILVGEEGDFENLDFKLNVVFEDENQRIVLRSTVISESIVHRVYEETENNDSMLRVPNKGYVEELNDSKLENRTKWFNIYDEDGNILKYGEISFMLEAVEILVGPDGDFENLDFKLNTVFDDQNQKIVLRSTIISESIVHRVYEESANEDSMLQVPSTWYVEALNDPRDINREKWFNQYNASGDVIHEGEIARMLQAVEILVGPDGDFENLDFKLATIFDDDNQKIVLRSTVISESIVHRVYDESSNDDSMIRIPNKGYVEALNDPNLENRTKWFNQYDEDGEIIEFGELRYMLEAVEILVGADGDFENLNFNLEELFDTEKQKEILKSKVISETIVAQIVTEANMSTNELKLPSDYYLETLNDPTDYNREKWFNTYDADGEVVSYGEIRNLLAAVDRLREPGGLIQELTFQLGALFVDEDQEVILRSKIVSETIVDKIFQEVDNGSLYLPSTDYVDPAISDVRDRWFNQYNGDVLVATGEIRALLEAVEHIVGEDGQFENLVFDLSVVFDDAQQNDILRSVVIAETIVHKIFEESESGVLIIPSSTYVNPLNDLNPFNRDKWFNTYYADETVDGFGEIHFLLEAAEILLDGGEFENINFDLNALFDPDEQEAVLKSYVFSETIIEKIFGEEDTVPSENIPTFDWYGRRLDDDENRDAWYNTYENGVLVKNELAKFLDSIALIIEDKTFEEMGEIVIDDIIEIDFNVAMNADKIVVSSNFDILLDSIIMESIVAPLVQAIVTDGGALEEHLDVPSGGYNFYKADLITDYDFSTYQSELYDTKTILDSIYIMNKKGIHYSELGNIFSGGFDLNDETIDGLGDAMVASRTFRGSIATMYNCLYIGVFNALPPMNLSGESKKEWDDVKFIQSDFDNDTPLEAHTRFTIKLKSWTDPMNTFYE